MHSVHSAVCWLVRVIHSVSTDEGSFPMWKLPPIVISNVRRFRKCCKEDGNSLIFSLSHKQSRFVFSTNAGMRRRTMSKAEALTSSHRTFRLRHCTRCGSTSNCSKQRFGGSRGAKLRLLETTSSNQTGSWFATLRKNRAQFNERGKLILWTNEQYIHSKNDQ